MLAYVVLIVAMLATVTESLHGHPCRVTTSFQKVDEELYANKTCIEGKIYWNYPSSRIRVIFERDYPDTDFDICLLRGGSIKYYKRAIDVSTGVELPLKIGEEHCVWSKEGRVTLDFESDAPKYYLVIIHYKVIDYRR